MSPEDWNLLRPGVLIASAMREFWPCVGLALLSTLCVTALSVARARIPQASHPILAVWLPIADTWPIYLWAIIASLNTLQSFEFMATQGLNNPPFLLHWVNALSGAIALAIVLVFAATSSVVGSVFVTTRRPPSFGPIAAVAAVGADWLFLLLFVSPFR